MKKSYKKRSVFYFIILFLSYVCFFPQAAFFDCVEPLVTEESSAQTESYASSLSLSKNDWIVLFDPCKDPFTIVWEFWKKQINL